MKLRNNNGFTGIDLSIALIVLLIFIPVLFEIIYNLKKVNQSVDRESTALNIAVEVLEKNKLEQYEKIENKGPYDEKRKDVTYQVTVTVTSQEISAEATSLSKKVNVKVEYPVGKNTKSIDISTTIKK